MKSWVAISGISLVLSCVGADPDHESASSEAAWLDEAQQQIAAREYHASENGQGLQAPNRAHNLRTYFETTGIRVQDRTRGGSPELLRLSLVGVGRGEQLVPAAAGEQVTADGGRVEIHRAGLVEWYLNSPEGLEQGFTLGMRPDGDGPLVVELAVSGARPSLLGDAVVFETGQRKLRYDELIANDSEGDALVARFEVPTGDRLRIVVDDAGAVYPIVIDPLLTETADAQLEANQGTTSFGAVAGAGDVNGDGYADLIVGASRYDNGQTDEGAAFLFYGSASGIANANPSSPGVQQLESNLQDGVLGYSVAGAGDVNGDGYADVIVGAPYYNSGQGVFEGAAFVFRGSASGLVTTTPGPGTAQLEGNQAGAQFGISVAGAGDVNGDGYADVIVGTDIYNAGQPTEGAAFVFLGSSSGIASGNPTTAATQLESNLTDVSFAEDLAGAGDVNGDGYDDVIVGARRFGNGQTNEGAAFLWIGSASGIADGDLGTASAQLESNQASALFGVSVAAAGDVNGDGYGDVIVGARGYAAGQSGEGAAFVFRGSSTGIASSNPATPGVSRLESNQANALMGESVAGAGDVNGDGYADVIVGAFSYDATPNDEGAAFVFLGSSSGVANGNPLTAFAQLESNQANSVYGGDVAGAGDVDGDGYADVVVGATSYDSGQTDEGAAFVYHGGGSGIADGNPGTAVAQLEANQTSALLGSSVASAGDVNADGYGDVIVGAREYDAGQSDEGAAFVFLGSASGIADGDPTTALAQLESNQAGALMGWSVAGAGDVNGDGYGDVIVGAESYSAGQGTEGAAFVFLGSATGIADGNPATAAARLESDQADALLGFSVAGAGDVNGDGYGDVIVGAPQYDQGQLEEGAAFVFRGGPAGVADGNPSLAGVVRLESDQAGAVLGASVAGAGDVNGDGYADVIAGAMRYSNGQPLEGAAFVFHGGASGVANGNPATADAQLESNLAAAHFGSSVATAGDTNGDGYADVIIGSAPYSAGQSFEGAAFVFRGSSSGIGDANPASAGVAQLESDQNNAGAINLSPSTPNSDILHSAAGAGDVNGDGYGDVVVGFPYYDSGELNEGAAFVFMGSASGIADGNPTTARGRLESNQESAYLGSSVASAGDVNGDGFADVVVGSARGTNYYPGAIVGGYDAVQSDEGAAFVYLGNSQGRPVLAHQERGNGSGIAVQPWGLAHSATGFTVELNASHPHGTGRVKAQLEACPAGVAFGDANCTAVLTSSWVDVNGAAPEAVLAETFTGLTSNALYRWRARVLHAPKTGATSANPAHGPWRRLDAQAAEGDIRLPEPGLFSLGAGLALVAGLARRRRHVR